MKVIQYNESSEPFLVADNKNGEALDVGGMGPDSIAAQITVSDSDSPNTASAQWQGSLDGENYFDLGSPVSISGDSVLPIVADPVYYKFYRVKYAITADKAALTNQSLTYTAVDAGPDGELITITLIDPPGNNVPLSISVVGTDIVVTLATDGSSTVTTTGNALKSALNADPDASALIVVSGTNASALNALTETSLSGASSFFTCVERKMVYGSRV